MFTNNLVWERAIHMFTSNLVGRGETIHKIFTSNLVWEDGGQRPYVHK